MTQFLINHLDRFLGKGLPFSTIFKFIIYNTASIISLAVPMATLIATMMAFGRLSSDNEIAAMRSVSASYFKLMTPAMLLGCIIA